MTFRGLKGFALLGEVTEKVSEPFQVEELIHIGKNTSFGFGRYHLTLQGGD
ncbi:MAG: CRISPR system precrRNA processing endoribonuclease RAMP protein Cas6 [Butyrivibrio sp.]|nr:CRISPR system precrRNA processing endoribonuclease RAMP protein Cas6 [Butyrivibrio sp.]